MVAGGEGTAEGCTRLTIVHITVGKEHACLSREALTDVDRLTHKAAIYLGSINHTGSRCHHTVFDDDIRPNERACIIGAHDGAVVEFATALHLTSFPYLDIVHLLHTNNTRTRTDVGSWQ